MASSPDKLCCNLKIDQFVKLKKYYSGNQLSLLLRKGVYQYDYLDFLKKLDETSLPPKEVFYSKLTGKVLQIKITNMLIQFGRHFDIESMKDYHKLCNLSDIVLLADIFETLGVFA